MGTGREGISGVITSCLMLGLCFFGWKFQLEGLLSKRLSWHLSWKHGSCWARDSDSSGQEQGLSFLPQVMLLVRGPLWLWRPVFLPPGASLWTLLFSSSSVQPPQAVSLILLHLLWQHCPLQPQQPPPSGSWASRRCPCGSHSRGLTFCSPVTSLSQYHQSVKRREKPWDESEIDEGAEARATGNQNSRRKEREKNKKKFVGGKHIVNSFRYRMFQVLKALSGVVSNLTAS